MVWRDSEFIIMVIGGPNARRDFHIDPGDEFFYQLEGDIALEYIDGDGERQKAEIKQGDVFLLPANVPHSPQRGEIPSAWWWSGCAARKSQRSSLGTARSATPGFTS